MIHGPDLGAMRERAKALVMRAFVTKAERDGTPATLRACYVLKASHAERVLAGGTSPWIDAEAAERGYTPYQMARVIAYMADESMAMEMDRMKVNIALEAAETEEEIIAIFDAIGLPFTMGAESSLEQP